MNKKFSERLTEYLDSECSDYSMSYTWEWNDDANYCEVLVKSDYSNREKCLKFKYNEEKDVLLIELGEDSFYETQEFDFTVKYFWMVVSPALFPEH